MNKTVEIETEKLIVYSMAITKLLRKIKTKKFTANDEEMMLSLSQQLLGDACLGENDE